MPTTFTLIASSTVGAGGAASIDFTSIPSTYTDLVLKYSIRGTNATPFSTIQVTFNGSTSTFTGKYLEGDGTTVGASTSPARYMGYLNAATSTANTFSNAEMYIPNYASSQNKSFSVEYVSENNATAAYCGIIAESWATTSAITSISLVQTAGVIAQYSTAYLYGISKS